jgi:hypothetical protein
MNPPSRSHRNCPQELIDEFLKNGNKITVCKPFETTENIVYTNGFYGKKQKTPTEQES